MKLKNRNVLTNSNIQQLGMDMNMPMHRMMGVGCMGTRGDNNHNDFGGMMPLPPPPPQPSHVQ